MKQNFFKAVGMKVDPQKVHHEACQRPNGAAAEGIFLFNWLFIHKQGQKRHAQKIKQQKPHKAQRKNANTAKECKGNKLKYENTQRRNKQRTRNNNTKQHSKHPITVIV